MIHDHDNSAAVELGEASVATKGAIGHGTDFVRELPSLGLSDD